MSKLQILRENFSTKIDCQRYLAELKWANGYKCRKCGHERYCKGRKHYFRKCLNCHFDESPTSGTLFHKIKFSLVQAFEIIYWITQTTKGMSSAEIGKHFGIHQTSAWRFRRKVQQAMKDLEGQKLLGMAEVDEFVVGSEEKKAQGRSLGKKQLAW